MESRVVPARGPGQDPFYLNMRSNRIVQGEDKGPDVLADQQIQVAFSVQVSQINRRGIRWKPRHSPIQRGRGRGSRLVVM